MRSQPKIGPSDSSDTLSDRPGDPDIDTDAAMTGERAAVRPEEGVASAETDVDRVVDAEEAGLGDGLDEAEEARLKKPRP
jgi:hypothetical protein